LGKPRVSRSFIRVYGKPLRAIGKAKFHGSISEKLANAKNKPSSPDLTHVRMVKAGDTLPLMTERIYGDDKWR